MDVQIKHYDVETEKAFLGALILNPVYIKGVTEETFWLEIHKVIYSAIQELQMRGDAIELLSVTNTIRNKGKLDYVGGATYLAGLLNIPTAENIKYYAGVIRKKELARKLSNLLEESLGHVSAENTREVITSLHTGLLNLSPVDHEAIYAIGQILEKYEEEQKDFSERMVNGQELIGFSCGFKKIDAMIDGIRPEHLWTVGGYTSMGKTAFSLNIVKSAILQSKRVVYYSLEMSQVDIVSRLLGVISGVTGQSIFKGTVATHELRRVQEAKKLLRESRMSIHSEISDIEDILLSMFEEVGKEPVDLFVIDYLQLVSSRKSEKEYDVMRSVATQFQAIAKKLKVPIVLLSQISNEAAKTPSSLVIGFKGAGNIAAASDIALELVSGEESNERLKEKLSNGELADMICMVKKNRHGKVGAVKMQFEGNTGIFYEGFKY